MTDVRELGIVFALAPVLHLLVAWRFAPRLRRRRKAFVLSLVLALGLSAAANWLGVSLISHYLGLAWAAAIVTSIWCLPLALSEPRRPTDWSPLSILKAVGVPTAVALGVAMAMFGGIQVQFVREGIVRYPFLYRAWIDGGVLSRKESWVVEAQRCLPWFPVLVHRTATAELPFVTADPIELHVTAATAGDALKMVVSVDSGDRTDVRLR